MFTQLDILKLALKEQERKLDYTCKLYDKKPTPEHEERFIAESKKYEYLKHLIKVES